MILPAMGIASDILSTFSRKPIFGYRAMAFSIVGIAFLCWIVWGHHMFQSGMNPTLGTSFMLTTMVIAVPSAIKTFNWLGTLWGGNIHFTHADALRHRLRLDVRDRRAVGHLHGLDAGRHLHPRHLLSSSRTSTTCCSAAACSASSPASTTGTRRCSAA